VTTRFGKGVTTTRKLELEISGKTTMGHFGLLREVTAKRAGHEEKRKNAQRKQTWGDTGFEGFRKPMTYAGPREGQESAHESADLKAKMVFERLKKVTTRKRWDSNISRKMPTEKRIWRRDWVEMELRGSR
jgi:hypothetical protein